MQFLKLSRSFNFTLRYIDDALLLNNYKFGDFADHIFTIELEIKDTIDTARSASCLDLHHRDLVKHYGVSVSHDHVICSICRNHNPVLSSFMIYYRLFNRSNTTGATCGA